MIRIAFANQNTEIVLTCSEVGKLKNPYYLFIATNEFSSACNSSVFADVSPNKKRFNLFQIPAGLFTAPGWYSLDIYEQLSELNTDPQAAGLCVESTRVFVEYDNAPVFNENSISNPIYKEYDGQ